MKFQIDRFSREWSKDTYSTLAIDNSGSDRDKNLFTVMVLLVLDHT